MSALTRRDFLKLGAAALAGLGTRAVGSFFPDESIDRPLGLARVTTELIYIYRQPSFRSLRLGSLSRDALVWLLEETLSLDQPRARNPRWYRIPQGYIYSAYLQLTSGWRLALPASNLVGERTLAEVIQPYTRSFRYTRAEGWQPLYRLYFQSTHYITAIDEGPNGAILYRITDYLLNTDYHVPACDVRMFAFDEYRPLATNVPQASKRIVVSLEAQSLSAFEGEQIVLQSPVSTGVHTPNLPPDELPTDTPTGSFRIQTKFPSRHMGDGRLTSDIRAYELPGVPWTMIFHPDGFALHGTYWHNNFGVKMSHGCINLPNPIAQWLFRWCEPFFDGRDWYQRGAGTLVQIQ